MKISPIKKLKLLTIHLLLEVLLFLDFLENTPKKAFKILLKGFVLISLLAFYSGLLVIESENHYLHTILKYKLIPNVYSSSTQVNVKIPYKSAELPLPPISARSYIIVDLDTNTVLEEYNSKTPLPPASTTKMMTAIVARDLYNLDEKVSIPEKCTVEDTQKVGFLPEELITVKDLIGSLLINSAGDSACALANGKVPSPEFISLMNVKALDNGLTSTNFANEVGLDNFSENHLMSAYDLYQLSLLLRKDPWLKELVQVQEYNITSGRVARKIFNTNDLLWDVPGTVGIKTGKTYGAGEVLVYEYDDGSRNVLIVIMGSLDRFGDTKMLLDWTLNSYEF